MVRYNCSLSPHFEPGQRSGRNPLFVMFFSLLITGAAIAAATKCAAQKPFENLVVFGDR